MAAGRMRHAFPDWPCWDAELLTVDPRDHAQECFVIACLRKQAWPDAAIAENLTNLASCELVIRLHPDATRLLSLAGDNGRQMLLDAMVGGTAL